MKRTSRVLISIIIGNYMSFEDVISIVSPSQASIDQVYSYFTANGISKNKIELHQSRDFVTVAMSVEQAETLFQVIIFFLIFSYRFFSSLIPLL